MVLLAPSVITTAAPVFVTTPRISANPYVAALRIAPPDSPATQPLLISAVRSSSKSAVADKAQVKGASGPLVRRTPSACHRVVSIIVARIPVVRMRTVRVCDVSPTMLAQSSHLCWSICVSFSPKRLTRSPRHHHFFRAGRCRRFERFVPPL